jgi:hypothetical protein
LICSNVFDLHTTTSQLQESMASLGYSLRAVA